MHAPTFAALKKERPDTEITVWVAPRGVLPLAKLDANVSHVIEAPIRRSLLLTGLHSWRLARRHFGTAVMLSPGQQWKGAAHMFLAGTHERIAHNYFHLGNPNSSFLLTKAIPEVNDLHDIEQNLRLLSALGIDDTQYHNKPYVALRFGKQHEKGSRRILDSAQIEPTRRLIALHPGSAPDFAWKRWPAERFVQLGKMLVSKYNAHVIVVGGSAEHTLKSEVVRGIGTHASAASGSLMTIAHVLKQCILLVSNDSGLMHLGAAAGAPTVGLFGPTDEKLTGPRGAHTSTIRADGTESVYSTEAGSDLGSTTHDSLLALEVSRVEQELSKYL